MLVVIAVQYRDVVDDLAHARAELVQLQSTERVLIDIEQLLAVRVAIETQRSKIRGLVEERPTPITCLPIQLLTRTFSFLLASSGAGEDLRGSLDSFSYTEEEFGWGYAILEGFNPRYS